jgi:hypothetical protein
VRHIPWWIYKDISAKNIAVDVIVVNHAVCEMHKFAVMHLLSKARIFGFPSIFIEGTGQQGVTQNFVDVKNIFKKYGYSLIYDKNDVYTFEYNVQKHLKNKIRAKELVYKLARANPFLIIIIKKILRVMGKIRNLFILRNNSNKTTKSIFPFNSIRYNDVLNLYEKISGNPDFKSFDEEFFSKILLDHEKN